MFRGTEKTQTTNLQGRRKQWSLARALLDKQQRAWLSQSMEPSEPEHTVFKRSIGSSAEVGGGAGVRGAKEEQMWYNRPEEQAAQCESSCRSP